MPFPPRPLDSTLHGVVDYTAGATLTTVFPKLAGSTALERPARSAPQAPSTPGTAC
jgi:hypothetical protein